jgi:hypothetical protein
MNGHLFDARFFWSIIIPPLKIFHPFFNAQLPLEFILYKIDIL